VASQVRKGLNAVVDFGVRQGRMNTLHIIENATVLAAVVGLVVGITIYIVADVLPEHLAKRVIRADSMTYTTASGCIIGILLMCGIPHTVFHGPLRALLSAGALSSGASCFAGVVGRLVGATVTRRTKEETVTRWVGNVAAYVAPVFVVPILSLA